MATSVSSAVARTAAKRLISSIGCQTKRAACVGFEPGQQTTTARRTRNISSASQLGICHQNAFQISSPVRLLGREGFAQSKRAFHIASRRFYRNDTHTQPSNHDRAQTETKGHSKSDGSERNQGSSNNRYRTHPRKLTLYAGASLVSVLVALSQPLSFVQVGHQGREDGEEEEDGQHQINTGKAGKTGSGSGSCTSSPPPAPTAAGDDRDPSLPRFRLADVRKHDAESGEPWVTSGDKVYDITAWVPAHPGGEVILRAAGQSIDPYWDIFTIHKAPHVQQILDEYLIGFVDSADLVNGQPAAENIEDPFADDPTRDGRLVVHTQKPCNAEPPPEHLASTFTTSNELFYVRNHMWVPVVPEKEAEDHRLTVELPDGEERSYTLAELRRRFPVHRVTAVLQCSGNRRSDMTRAVGPTNGLQWAAGAISNAVWEGVLLRDVLADAGLRVARDDRPSLTKISTEASQEEDEDDLPPADSLHVQMSGLEAYGASIPLPAALDPRGDVLLAFAMNGKPLPRDHGYPLRAVVPGHVAARSVKWLAKIVVADEESPAQWQRRDYKMFGPNEGAQPDWDKYPAMQELPVTSAITGVWVGDRNIRQAGQPLPTGGGQHRAPPGTRDLKAWQAAHDASQRGGVPVAVAGYAYAGGGREVVRVDVSVDGGRTWDQAELLDQKSSPGDDEEARRRGYIVNRSRKDWAWKRWRYGGVILPGGDGTTKEGGCADILVKATDSAYNAQPERHDGIYTVRGNLATAWHRVRACPCGEKKGEEWSAVRLSGCGFDKPEEGPTK